MDLKFKRKNKTLIILVAGEIEEEILSSGFRR